MNKKRTMAFAPPSFFVLSISDCFQTELHHAIRAAEAQSIGTLTAQQAQITAGSCSFHDRKDFEHGLLAEIRRAAILTDVAVSYFMPVAAVKHTILICSAADYGDFKGYILCDEAFHYRLALIFSIIASYSSSVSFFRPGFMANTPPHSYSSLYLGTRWKCRWQPVSP